MNKKSLILDIVVLLLIFASAGVTFYRYIILKDYPITFKIGCNPEIEVCYISECNVEENTECAQDLVDRKSYYKLVEKSAGTIPGCDPEDPVCLEQTCPDQDSCKNIICNEDTVPEGESCSLLSDK